ncbi:uncharacterized protein METZ01_LOCUS86495 [marine metagenome]|uniref:Uncharacterized protein n=1 Tax=marine metagenome TaxID=408172 RepID=A0A381V101_9ZZZZ
MINIYGASSAPNATARSKIGPVFAGDPEGR